MVVFIEPVLNASVNVCVNVCVRLPLVALLVYADTYWTFPLPSSVLVILIVSVLLRTSLEIVVE